MHTKFRYFIRISIIFLLLPLLLPGYRAEAASVKIKLNKMSVIMYTEVEKTVKLSATVTGSSKKIKWGSSNKKVAVVNAFGKVTAKKVGTAVITAKIGKAVAKCNVTVEKESINVPEVKITVNSYNSLLLKWEKVSGASGYAIWRKTAGTPFKQITVLSSAGKCSYVDKKLSTGTKYFYVIKAYKKFENKTIWSATSKRITAIPKMTKPIIRFVKVNGSKKLTVTSAGLMQWIAPSFRRYWNCGTCPI